MTITPRSVEDMLERERVANIRKHWVRAVTACNSRCLFCLDMDTPRNVFLSEQEVKAELDRGRDQLGADKVIISGGEASLHPLFPEFIRYARERGYSRVQTVTNGHRFADREFFQRVMDAGLGEITFSLHGHTPALHDHLTQSPGAFNRLMKGLLRSLRDGRPIVNVDVVINKQNVAVIDKIVELCISVGVTEFDLLHVIPQAEAFRNRDQLFYDVREHLPTLHKVFRLNRHPRFVIWTNRFPVSFLEGLEDLIQDPHKMLDEINGRRFQVRRYLDEGAALDCRQPERCVHCFIEPFCTTMDRAIAAQNQRTWDIWWGPKQDPLPFGCTAWGLEVERARELVGAGRVYARVKKAEKLPDGIEGTIVADTTEKCEAWLGTRIPAGVEIEISLTNETGPWLLAHRELLADRLDVIRIDQPSHEHLDAATAHDLRDPAGFFRALDLRVRVAGLPACLAPGAILVERRRLLDHALFDRETGRLDVHALARHHVKEGYHAKSARCADCRVNDRCDGAHINFVRDQGLGRLGPLTTGAWADDATAQLTARWPVAPARIADGRPLEPVAPSLPGFAAPGKAPLDPLAIIAAERLLKKRRK
jgi:MoaA/NifB/PqqE/SkfB family radical SAM enzyme